MIGRSNFLGLDGFVWWIGEIVNVADPLQSGRCQVRIFGWHTENKAQLPDSDLPWAIPLYPINAPRTFSTPNLTDWVVGFFMDGPSGQFPILMGVLPGINPDNPITPAM